VYSEVCKAIPPEQVMGIAAGPSTGYGKDGKPFPDQGAKLLLNDIMPAA